MNTKDFFFKLQWWVKEHLFACRTTLKNQVVMEYHLPDGYKDFSIHPCVRYIPQGINGHKWWMVLTPYQNYDVTKENIELYYGIDDKEGNPPTKWKFVREVCGKHSQGYNSDPNLLFENGELWIIWREWETENLPPKSPICFIRSCKTCDGVTFSEPQALAYNEYKGFAMSADSMMCPTLITFKGKLILYGSYYEFSPHLNPIGLSYYVQSGALFKMKHMIPNKKLWFDMWHFDMFILDNYIYQIITGQFGNAIYLGRSTDGINFEYSKKPLHCNILFIKKNYYYKPTAQVFNNKLYVFYPCKISHGIVRIVRREISLRVFRNLFFYS